MMKNECKQPLALSRSTSAAKPHKQQDASPVLSQSLTKKLQASSLPVIRCTECESKDCKLVITSLRGNGTRYRRYECQVCNTRFSTFNEEGPPAQPRTIGFRANPASRRFTDREAAEIILSRSSLTALAQQYKASRETIRQIRLGMIYREVWLTLHPDRIPEQAGASCTKCLHWSRPTHDYEAGFCSMGFPEARQNHRFAEECNTYTKNTSNQ